jgi:xanthine/CO dehydrogenase XdhC/CoxF family maturation factor
MTIERQILDAAARLRRQREPHLIATVVHVQGSAYRRPGARMLLTQFRWITGSVSGGCLEGDIAKKGWWRTQDGEPVVVTYDSRVDGDADDDDIRSAFGLGCSGVVEVMLERAGTAGRVDPLAFASECLHAQTRGAIVTAIRSTLPEIKVGFRVCVRDGEAPYADSFADELLRTAMIADARAAIASGVSGNRTYASTRGSVEVFIEAVVPPPRVFVFGTGHDAVPVVEFARKLGWDVTVCADQVSVTTRERFRQADEILVGTPADLAARIEECDRAVAIVMNHNYDLDRLHLGMLLESNAKYIGVLGPRARTTRILDELGVIADSDTRLHAPIGLTIGAETPHEIALAIIAEVKAVLARVPAQSLRDRSGPIHARSMPRIAHEIETVAIVEPRPSREIAAVGDIAAASADVEPVQRISRELAVANPVA